MSKYKKLSGKIYIKQTNNIFGEPTINDGREMNSPYISTGDENYSIDLDVTTIEIRYYANKNTQPNQSRNTVKQGRINTDAEREAILDIYEPKSKGKPFET